MDLFGLGGRAARGRGARRLRLFPAPGQNQGGNKDQMPEIPLHHPFIPEWPNLLNPFFPRLSQTPSFREHVRT